MRAQNQILMVALAVVFAIALALTVAMICLSAMREEEAGQAPATTPSPGGTQAPEGGGAPQLTTGLPAATETPDDGLLYRSNGDGSCTLIGIGSCQDAFVVIPAYTATGERVTRADIILDGAEGAFTYVPSGYSPDSYVILSEGHTYTLEFVP